MISKKLIHQIVTFLNNYLGNKYVVAGYTHYGKDCINVQFGIWSIDKNNIICKNVGSHNRYICNEQDFNNFKENVINHYEEELKLAKEQSYERA